MVNDRNKLFAAEIRRPQESKKIPTDYLINDRVEDPNRKNSRTKLHISSRTQLLSAGPTAFRAGNKGCRGQLLIPSAIYEDCRKRRRKNISIALIDYH
jgi:hypothetical protein